MLDGAGNLYVEADSSTSSVVTIQQFAKDTWSDRTIVSGYKLLLGFAWPTTGSSRSTLAGTQLSGIGHP